jgi:SAM-dependent methyltransferase
MSRRSFSTGSGPGAITPDGCAVDLYRSLPVGDEPAIIHATVPPQASILELGCGTGRVTHPLIALGHQLTAVDESPEMLAHLRGARVVCGRIEELALDERFDVVVLGSHLVNVPDDDALAAILACCARHVAATGCVVIERHPESWFDDAKDMEAVRDGITFRLRNVSRPAADLVAATVEYRVGDREWSQSFVSRRLDDALLRDRLRDAGLRVDARLTDDGGWILARPA